MNKLSVEFKWQGLLDYQEALSVQLKYWERVREVQKGAIVIGLEHPATITLGKRGDRSSDIATDSPLPVIEIDRGGQATLHSPGQLVIYPIVHLSSFQLGVRSFVDLLMQVTAELLLQEGIMTHQRPGNPGLFTERGKIAFCGLRVERGITRHGIAINISNDLNLFKNIISCGVRDSNLDSVALNSEKSIQLNKSFERWSVLFKEALEKMES